MNIHPFTLSLSGSAELAGFLRLALCVEVGLFLSENNFRT